MSMIRVGVDRRRDGFYLARLDLEQPGSAVGLSRHEDLGKSGEEFSDSSRISVAVPDREVQVKALRLPVTAGAAINDVIRFELAESLLEDSAAFEFEAVPTADSDNQLGLIYRKETLDDLTSRYGLGEINRESLTYQARALALGRGYAKFCERAAGEFLCVVDLAENAASVCFLVKDTVVDLSRIDPGDFDPASETARRQFAIDLKTIVNFRRALLMDRGITLPLSTLVLSGDGVDDDFRAKVRDYFPSGVEAPRLRASVLTGENVEAGLAPEAFLVALGLAAN
jgi:hypothetical protein